MKMCIKTCLIVNIFSFSLFAMERELLDKEDGIDSLTKRVAILEQQVGSLQVKCSTRPSREDVEKQWLAEERELIEYYYSNPELIKKFEEEARQNGKSSLLKAFEKGMNRIFHKKQEKLSKKNKKISS